MLRQPNNSDINKTHVCTYHFAESKVSYFEVLELVAAQDVLGLQVAVHNACDLTREIESHTWIIKTDEVYSDFDV